MDLIQQYYLKSTKIYITGIYIVDNLLSLILRKGTCKGAL